MHGFQKKNSLRAARPQRTRTASNCSTAFRLGAARASSPARASSSARSSASSASCTNRKHRLRARVAWLQARQSAMHASLRLHLHKQLGVRRLLQRWHVWGLGWVSLSLDHAVACGLLHSMTLQFRGAVARASESKAWRCRIRRLLPHSALCSRPGCDQDACTAGMHSQAACASLACECKTGMKQSGAPSVACRSPTPQLGCCLGHEPHRT